MNILVFNWQDRRNPQAGGAELHLHEIFGRLARAGHQVTLLASGWRGAPARLEIDGIEVHRTGGRHTYPLRVARYYREYLAERRFDVVVEDLNKVPLYTPRWIDRPLALLVPHLFGTTAFREASLPVAAATWLLERPIGRVYRGVPAVAISESTRDDLVARGLRREDVSVIYSGVDLEFFSPADAPRRAAPPTFAYVGRLRRYKGVELMLRAVALLRDRGVAVRLRIAGRGPHEPRLRRLAARLALDDRVEFLGYVDEEAKRELLRSAWANLYTSPKEGWGLTNVEAAACGTATVASDSPGLRESVVDGATGLLVPHGDVPALAAALQRLAADPAQVERMGAAAARFAQGFRWDAVADAVARFLQRAAGDLHRSGSPPQRRRSA